MSLSELKGVRAVTENKLNKLGIFTKYDLLNFLPKKYLDLSKLSDISELIEGNFVFIKINIDNIENLRRFNKINFFRAHGIYLSKNIYLTWFNQPYMQKNITLNEVYFAYGKLKSTKGGFEIINPHFERAENAKRLKGIVPVYPTKGFLNQKTVSNFIKEALKTFEPEGFINNNLKNAYKRAHFPALYNDATSALREIKLDEAVKLILSYKIFRTHDKRSFFYKDFEIDTVLQALPFDLTESQLQAVLEITGDLKKPLRMNRILCGDTGSGKTAVSLVVAYLAIKNGGQVALMVPTEILAEQHFNFFRSVLNKFGFKIEVLTGSTPAKEKNRIYKETAEGKISMLIATVAIFNEKLNFHRLALALTDEQQRFGVMQKTELELKGFQTDSLVLSATPIPRALQLIGYGELALSKIEKRFENENIATGIVSEEKTQAMLEYIADSLKKGKQAFFVCPRIEDDEGIELDAAKNLFESLKSNLYKDINIALLHGKMKANEKRAVIEGLRSGDISALVATTVIEVGIDVPNVSIIAIMNADRFGLSALHQLRGRVGRDGKQAYCFLHTGKDAKRMQILLNSKDGFEIAEEDFKIRGGGDFIGVRQSGKEAISDFSLLMEAKAIAENIKVLNETQKAELQTFYNSVQKISLN